jgi:hypothetical protein
MCLPGGECRWTCNCMLGQSQHACVCAQTTARQRRRTPRRCLHSAKQRSSTTHVVNVAMESSSSSAARSNSRACMAATPSYTCGRTAAPHARHCVGGAAGAANQSGRAHCAACLNTRTHARALPKQKRARAHTLSLFLCSQSPPASQMALARPSSFFTPSQSEYRMPSLQACLRVWCERVCVCVCGRAHAHLQHVHVCVVCTPWLWPELQTVPCIHEHTARAHSHHHQPPPDLAAAHVCRGAPPPFRLSHTHTQAHHHMRSSSSRHIRTPLSPDTHLIWLNTMSALAPPLAVFSSASANALLAPSLSPMRPRYAARASSASRTSVSPRFSLASCSCVRSV